MSRSKNGPAPSSRGNFTPPSQAAASPGSPGALGTAGALAPPATGSRFAPRNWRVPTRLYAILLIPVIVGLVMGGFQVKGSIDTWREAENAQSTARLVRAALTYSQRLVDERDISAAPLLRGDRDDADVAKARAATDRAGRAFDDAARQMPHTDGLERRLAAFRKAEPGLAKLRANAYTGKLGGVQTEEGYVAVQHPLMEFANELGLGTGNITSYGRTVYAISLTKAALSLQRSIGTHLLVKPGPTASDLGRQRVALSSYAYLEGIATEEYRSGGTEQDAAVLAAATAKLRADAQKDAEKGAARAEAEGRDYVPPPSADKMVAAIAALPGTDRDDRGRLAAQGVTVDSWWQANTAKFDADRKIESDLADRAVSEASGIADDARRSTFVTGAAVLVALLAALVLAGLMARQMSRSMRELRTAALGIAQQRLPMIVDQLSRTAPGQVDTRVRPLPITSRDEIGEVARAFDQVHREAVRLAAEQAMLRGNVNAIFANLSRRNESLIEGQLGLITDLENRETDPDQLASLFRLDHLATRMRRNGENLLVLSGKEPSRSWDQPVPLVDVVRAAASEVEQYHRIELVGIPDTADIHGSAVTDLVHLLAELLENATAFSSPEAKVRVTATRLPDGRVVIEIHDQGIGLTPEDFADINHKLANPPAVDAALSQRMGLFVVGRLADRHGIRVRLRPSAEQAGTTSLVMLPDAITHGGGGEAQQDSELSEFTVSSIIPEQQAQPATPLRTAAELGFDDSRYPDAADAPLDLDPVVRSLRRGERNAARAGAGAHPVPATATDQAGGRITTVDGMTPAGNGMAPAADGTARGADGLAPAVDGVPTGAALRGAAGHVGTQAYGQQASYGQEQASYGQGQAAYGQGQASYGRETAHDGSYAAFATPGAPGPAEGPTGPHSALQPPYSEPQPSYTEPSSANWPGTAQAYPADQDWGSHQGEWAQQGSFQAARPISDRNETEPRDVTDGNTGERVGFDQSGPASSSNGPGHELTGAGLPRRGSAAGGGPISAAASRGPGRPTARQESGGQQQAGPGAAPSGGGTPAADRGARGSAHEEHGVRAEPSRTPRAGGVTPSGLPRRTPRANLVEGAATRAPQSGPEVSRAPEDVRGRLSNLRRGVQQGRSEGSNSNGRPASDHDSGQRGFDSTYNQER